MTRTVYWLKHNKGHYLLQVDSEPHMDATLETEASLIVSFQGSMDLLRGHWISLWKPDHELWISCCS